MKMITHMRRWFPVRQAVEDLSEKWLSTEAKRITPGSIGLLLDSDGVLLAISRPGQPLKVGRGQRLLVLPKEPVIAPWAPHPLAPEAGVLLRFRWGVTARLPAWLSATPRTLAEFTAKVRSAVEPDLIPPCPTQAELASARTYVTSKLLPTTGYLCTTLERIDLAPKVDAAQLTFEGAKPTTVPVKLSEPQPSDLETGLWWLLRQSSVLLPETMNYQLAEKMRRDLPPLLQHLTPLCRDPALVVPIKKFLRHGTRALQNALLRLDKLGQIHSQLAEIELDQRQIRRRAAEVQQAHQLLAQMERDLAEWEDHLEKLTLDRAQHFDERARALDLSLRYRLEGHSSEEAP